MIRRLAPRCMSLLLCLVLMAPAISGVALAQDSAGYRWDELPRLPDTIGLGGPFAGVHRGTLIVAGGANFPNGPPWGPQPGEKVWHDRVYALSSADAGWVDAGRLPRRLAYGGSISTPDGLVLIGGEEDGVAADNVLRLRYVSAARRIEIESLPPLPRPASYIAATHIGTRVFVVASHRSANADRLDEKSFWSLDLAAVRNGWENLPAWPGTPRHKTVLVAQQLRGEHQVYLISGSNPRFDDDNQPDLGRFQFFTDCYRYDPRRRSWSAVASLPVVPPDTQKTGRRPVAAACGIAVGEAGILVFSGATGRHLLKPVEDRPRFPTDVLRYDTGKDRWSVVSHMPVGVVTTTVTEWTTDEASRVATIVIPSGEVRPGVRTPKVQRLRVQP